MANKKLSEMTLEELWRLFPIILTPHRDCWEEWYREKTGYICMSRSACRWSFNKGYTENGFAEKVFHLHLRFRGDHDELYFRDYLLEHPDTAYRYQELKLELAGKFRYNRDAYTDAKTGFVRKYTEEQKRITDAPKSRSKPAADRKSG